jgi:uncharacterized phage protein (TIGR01671 family)
MNRIIKFRGRKNSNKKWIYGSLVSDKIQGYAIIQIMDNPIFNGIISGWCFGIEKGTEGQFTGLLDKNGKEIYEGDILSSVSSFDSRHSKKKNPYYVVIWDVCSFKVKGYNGDLPVTPELTFKSDWEIIGNIYENHELLK